MNEMSSNNDVQKSITVLAVEQITGQSFEEANVEIGPLRINNFSYVFPITIYDGNKYHKVYVKIPKEVLRSRIKTVLPITKADKSMAENEVKSLQILASQWDSEDIQISWVVFRNFIPQYNAIITNRVEAPDALKLLRRMELCGRFGLKKDQLRLRDTMARLGEALGRFHQKNLKKIVFRLSDDLSKLEYYCNELQKMTNSKFTGRVMQDLKHISGFTTEAWETQTLKGIDIRNVLMDEIGKISLLDPGRIKLTCREADLARFIMTYRILYWGSNLFLLRLRPDLRAEEAFLEAYYSACAPPDSKLLSLYLVKEQLKHWHTAIGSLYLKKWTMPVKKMVASIYVNPFYTRQLKKELKKVV